MKLENKSLNRAFSVCLFLGYLFLNGLLFFFHEPWRDEANVWLIARELSPLELLREIKYQGHPCLWYFIVMPFAKIGLPFRTIEALSFLVMAITAALFLRYGQINILAKAVCLFSPVFTYFYPVVARNYCLIALLLVILAWLFPQRNEKCVWYGLLLGLLVQADTIAIPEAGMLSLMWLCENAWCSIRAKNLHGMKKVIKGIWIPAVSLLLWIFQFYEVSDSPQFNTRNMGFTEMLNEIKVFAYGIFTRITGWEQKTIIVFLALGMVTMLLLSVRLRNGWAMSVLAVSFLFQASFSALVYQLHIWHYISLCFVFIWVIWALKEQLREKQKADKWGRGLIGAVECLLVLLCIGMTLHWNSEAEISSLGVAMNGLYSDAEGTAGYIQNNLSEEDIIVTANIPMASTVVAYLPEYNFYFAGNGQKSSYADWSEEQSVTTTLQELIEWGRENFSDKKELYLLWTEDACIEEAEELESYERLYRTEEKTVRGEEYTIYKISLYET